MTGPITLPATKANLVEVAIWCSKNAKKEFNIAFEKGKELKITFSGRSDRYEFENLILANVMANRGAA